MDATNGKGFARYHREENVRIWVEGMDGYVTIDLDTAKKMHSELQTILYGSQEMHKQVQ